MDKRLWRNAEGVGNTINVVEVSNDLCRVMDGAVVKTVATQFIQIRCC